MYLYISFTFAGISLYRLWHIMLTYATEQQVWAKGLFCFTGHLLNSASIVPYDLSLNHVAAVLCPLTYWRLNCQHSPGGVKLRELFQTEGRRQETSSSNDRLCEALLQKDFTQIGLPPFDSLNTTPRHSTSETIIIICELVGTFKWKQMKQIRLILEMHKAWIYSPDNIIHFEFQVLI